MEKELISVIIPMYNVEPYIERCVRSVLDGSYRQVEVICVDDGSTDGTLAAARRLEAEDSRVRVLAQENRGVSAARNYGLKEAKGAYIAFIDADDWVSEEYLSTLYELAQEKQADIVRCGFFSTGRYHPPVQFPADSVFEVYQVPENKKRRDLIHSVWCALYRKAICPLFDVGVQIGEDILYNIRILSNHENVSAWICTKRMYAHYVRRSSLIGSSGIEEHSIAFHAIVDRLDTLPVKKYAVICAVKQALAFREHIDLAGKPEHRPRANAMIRQAIPLLLRCREVPLSERMIYLPFLCSAKLYRWYRRNR